MTPRARENIEFLGYSLLLLALVLSVVAGLNTYRNWEFVHNLPTVDGQVIGANIYQTTEKLLFWHQTVYVVRWLVRYSLDGRVYVSSAELGYKSGDRVSMEARANRLRPGTKVQVRYDPNEHGRILLSARPISESNPALLTVLEIAGVAILAGIALLTYARRQNPQP
ncbi:MAG TPA: DUF3592 domain-containing protein [Terriglobales bacterium]|nr:DUF3592 domain-containing protein [Terriglobales bacterium]